MGQAAHQHDVHRLGGTGLLGVIAAAAAVMQLPAMKALFSMVSVPMATFGVVALLCLFNVVIMRTRLGQQLRAVGQSGVVANAAGIDVDRVRIIAIVFSTILAGWGQLIFVQNMGSFQTYGAHEQVGLYAGAAILVGGASVIRATNTQALVGCVLFHLMFILAPAAGKNLFGDAAIGEYFRVFICYGVIALALVMHAWSENSRRKQAASALQWAVSEMERRLKVFERLNVRKISTYNEKQAAGEFEHYDNPPQKMPYLVIIIDELSDLMMVAGKDVEASIVRIAQLGRAAGIHLIVATQRPSSNVVTGLIKANITNRIAFNVATGIDSRVIIDQMGAEKLTGLGDMLFSKVDWGKPRRIQGCFVSDDEINEIVEFVKSQSEPDYHEEILSAVAPASMSMAGGGGIVRTGVAEPQDDDPLIWEAAHIVVESQLGSTSGLQRRLKVGYARAGRIMDMLEEKGVVGPPDGSKPREVLLDEEGLAALESVDAEMAREDREFGGF